MGELTAEKMNNDGAAALVAAIVRGLKRDFQKAYRRYRRLVHNAAQLDFYKREGKPEHQITIYTYEHTLKEIIDCPWFSIGKLSGEDVANIWRKEVDNEIPKIENRGRKEC